MLWMDGRRYKGHSGDTISKKILGVLVFYALAWVVVILLAAEEKGTEKICSIDQI